MSEKTYEREFGVGPNRIGINRLNTLEEMKSVVGLQETIWGYGRPGAAFPYPDRCLFEFAESGGLIGGAFDQGVMIGFSAAWLGMDKKSNSNYLHSQLVGIQESYRNSGVGYQLKLHQRDYARNANLRLIKWTFDPLKTRNANLNIRKLGGIIRSYTEDYYGNLQSKFNKGLATDRFWVEWYVDSPRVALRVDGQQNEVTNLDAPIVNQLKTGLGSYKQLDSFDLSFSDNQIFVEVPNNIESMLEDASEVAKVWQLGIRKIFTHYFGQGYILTDLVKINHGESRICYKLIKSELEAALA